ncbi:hypothetical protein CPB85DRAFT_257904 [Mucidula mucida]|nr:hypothetical protein CPB85DRAFT_257904 [Mucidula mucida]
MIHSYDVTQVPKFSSSLCPKLSRSVLALTMAQVAGMAVRDAAPLSVLECKAGLLQRSTKVQEDTGRNHHLCSKELRISLDSFPSPKFSFQNPANWLLSATTRPPALFHALHRIARATTRRYNRNLLPPSIQCLRARPKPCPQLPWRQDTKPSFAMPVCIGQILWTKDIGYIFGRRHR